jgi:phage portal protein BeeE
MDRDLFGNDFWYRIENRVGDTIGFQHVPYGTITPWPSEDPRVLVGCYRYWINGKWITYKTEQIVHWKFGKDPENLRLGLSLIRAACRDICTENELSTLAASVARNMGIAPYFVQPLLSDDMLKSGEMMPQSAADAIRSQLNEKTRDKRGQPLIMRWPMKVERLAFSPQELDSPKTRDTAATRICMALGMDPMLIGAPSTTRTFSNYPEARSAYFEDNIMPEGMAFCEKLNTLFHNERQLAPDEHLAFNSDEVPAFQEGRAARAKEADDGFKSGRLTLNEARAACGEPPADDDGFIWELIPGVKIDGAVVPQSVNKPMEPGGASAKNWARWNKAHNLRRLGAERNGHAVVRIQGKPLRGIYARNPNGTN